MDAAPAARERAVIVGALVATTAISWAWLAHLARGMDDMASMAAGAMPMAWSPRHAAFMFAMWWVMMIGMMLPGALPMVLTFATVNRRRRERGSTHVPTALFAAGYLGAWGLFSVAATAAQWALERAALMTPQMALAAPVAGGLLFLAAGAYQLSPLKHACLRHCRSPLDFVVNRWREGRGGALRMGAEHGMYCLGCCALLMALLFAVGVMNLLWIAALTVFVLLEKLLPAGAATARVTGLLSIAFGAWLLAPAFA